MQRTRRITYGLKLVLYLLGLLVFIASCTLPLHGGTIEMANVAEAFICSAFSMCQISVGCCYAVIDVCGYTFIHVLHFL